MRLRIANEKLTIHYKFILFTLFIGMFLVMFADSIAAIWNFLAYIN